MRFPDLNDSDAVAKHASCELAHQRQEVSIHRRDWSARRQTRELRRGVVGTATPATVIAAAAAAAMVWRGAKCSNRKDAPGG